MLDTAVLSLGMLRVAAPSETTDEEALWDPAMRAAVPGFAPGEPYADSARLFQGIPGLERAPGGRLWATWYSGGVTEGPENYVVLVTSGDDGLTWSEPKVVIDPPGNVRAFDPCLWVDPRGRLWLFYAQSYSWYDGRAGVWAMVTEQPDAEQPVWSAPQRLCDGIMMNKPIATERGDWLLPAAVWGFSARGLMDQEFRRNPLSFPATNVVASVDHGALWELRGQAHIPYRACDEHLLVERRDGSLWMLVRTSYGIAESISTDGGATWTPGAKAATVSHIPAARFFIRRLHSGRLLLVKHDPPDGRSRSHLTAYLSEDDGHTWRGGLLLDARPGVSYPDGCQAEDGRIYVVYDYQRTRDRQILMAVFTAEDILDQRFSSPCARDRVLLNQATGQRDSDSYETADNADGEPLNPDFAKLEAELAKLAAGAKLFTNRSSELRAVPALLAGRSFVRSAIGGVKVTVTAPGTVLVVTPSPGRNRDSLAEQLIADGFTKTNLPEFLLFCTGTIDDTGQLCSVYQKTSAKGDVLELAQWGVVVV